jgi:hypothetical protein
MSEDGPKIGDPVTFVNPTGKQFSAVVTANWGTGPTPSINVVYVTDDTAKTDTYGRQIERNTSVVHRSNQAAHGMYWY